MNELVLRVKLLVAALPATVGLIDGFWLVLPVLLVQVISAVQEPHQMILLKHTWRQTNIQVSLGFSCDHHKLLALL